MMLALVAGILLWFGIWLATGNVLWAFVISVIVCTLITAREIIEVVKEIKSLRGKLRSPFESGSQRIINIEDVKKLDRSKKTALIGIAISSLIFIYLFYKGILNTGDTGPGTALLGVMIFVALMSIARNDNGTYWITVGVILIYALTFMPVLNAWSPIIGQKASSATAQLGVGDRIGALFDSTKHALNNTWLLLTNPEAWYTQQFVEKGKREEGATNLAVEIEKIEVYPTKAMASTPDYDESISVLFTFSNRGSKDAENVIYGVYLDSGVDDGAVLESENQVYGRSGAKSLDTLIPNQKVMDDINILTPFCPGIYKGYAYVRYDYTVNGYANLQFMNDNYYQELLRKGKLVPRDEPSVSSAGPFRVTLRTNKLQPIPVKDNTAKFKFYVGIINEREGRAYLRSVKLYLPDGFVPTKDGSCDFEKDSSSSSLNGYNVYKLKTNILSSEAKKCLQPKDSKIFSCDITYQPQTLVQTETKVVKVAIDYTFRYEKEFKYSVSAPPEYQGMSCDEIKNMDKVKEKLETREKEAICEKKDAKECLMNAGCDIVRKAPYYENMWRCMAINPNTNTVNNIILAFAQWCLHQSDGSPKGKECGRLILDPIDESCAETYKLSDTQFTVNIDKNNEDVEVRFGNYELYSTKVYTLSFKYLPGQCGIEKGIFVSVKENDVRYECNLKENFPCKYDSQCESGYSCVKADNNDIANKLQQVDTFVYNLAKEHGFEWPNTYPIEDSSKCKIHYRIWLEPEYILELCRNKIDNEYYENCRKAIEIKKFISTLKKKDVSFGINSVNIDNCESEDPYNNQCGRSS